MQDWKSGSWNLLTWTVVASLARLFIHRGAVARGERAFWSLCLFWEGLVAVLIAILGGGLAEQFELGPWGTHALVGLFAWIGPKGIDALAQWALALITSGGPSGKGG